MPDVSIKFIGLDEVIQGAEAFGPELRDQLRRAIKKATFGILGASRTFTPVDTGFLRGPGMKTTFEDLIGVIENIANYAIFVHDGTSKMRARPFFDEGIQTFGSSIDPIFEKSVEVTIDRAFS